MNFNEIDEIKKAGFCGFIKISDLFVDSSAIPRIKGVYLILTFDKKSPEYLKVGSGGHFKEKNPNVTINQLESNWIENTLVVYIGKAGSDTSKATLQSRLRQFLRFGQGKNVGHWGGRLIWQLKNSEDLIVCWKAMSNGDPRILEADLIHQFLSHYSNRPFANLAD